VLGRFRTAYSYFERKGRSFEDLADRFGVACATTTGKRGTRVGAIVALVRSDRVVIAADSCSVQGSEVLSADHHPTPKIIRIGSSLLGIVGASSARHAVAHYFSRSGSDPKLGSVADIYETWLELHAALRADYFLNASQDDGEYFESSQMDVLIANASGAYLVTAYRSVDVVARFHAIGTGEMYAMGALHALYLDPDLDPETIADRAIAAAAEFDAGTSVPSQVHTVMR
jgi:ATP-dependent HslUV protease subunit HslV